MWIRDSANQILPYIDYIKHDGNLKRLFLGAIYMQAHFLQIDPFANAFNEPREINTLAQHIRIPTIHREAKENLGKREVYLMDGGK